MKITRIASGFAASDESELKEIFLSADGLRDGQVSLTDEAVVRFCKSTDPPGLCTSKFRADLIVDELVLLPSESLAACGEVQFRVEARRKHCYPGCSLHPAECRLNGRVLYLKVLKEGLIHIGDEIVLMAQVLK